MLSPHRRTSRCGPGPGWACVFLASVLLLAPASLRAEKLEELKPQGYVNDFAGVLSEQAQQKITALCTEVDQKTHAQLAVVTIHTLEGVEAADFANRLFQRWGVGHKDDNRGVLFLLAVNDRKYWVEVGYGLEPILPDGKVGGFGREMAPLLRAGDYGGAALHLTGQIAGVIAADRGVTLSSLPSAPPASTQQGQNGKPLAVWQLLLILLVLVLIVPFAARVVLSPWFWLLTIFGGGRGGRSGGGWGGGFGGGGGGGGFGGFGGGMSGGGGAGGGW